MIGCDHSTIQGSVNIKESMLSSQRISATYTVRSRTSGFRKPSSKDLDLFLLAGCSCLMTILYHPVAEALQTAQTSGSTAAISTTARQTASNPMNAFHLVVPVARDENQEEEDAVRE
jgi:hypothetical protein